ncbi:MAG: tRNA pseudouridine(55) synthase TruB [Desulfitobacteriaceae bacterium]
MDAGNFSFLFPPAFGLQMPEVVLSQARAEAFVKGLPTLVDQVDNIGQAEVGMEVQVLTEGRFIGIGIWQEERLCPHKVFT